MSKPAILINLNRCIGCWTCSMACKIGHDLADDEWRQTIRTLGNGEGIDRPSGSWPNLHMEWMPIYSKKCNLCAERLSEGDKPYCVSSCPLDAMTFGNLDDMESAVNMKLTDLRNKGFRIFTLPSWENQREGIIYAKKG